MRVRLARIIEKLTLGAYKLLKPFASDKFLEEWKPIHLCWWFIKHGLPIPQYFIAAATAPTVTDSAATSVLELSATGNGNVTSNGGSTTGWDQGFVFSITSVNSNPLQGGTGVTTKSTGGSGTTGAYTGSLSPLVAGTGYSYKAYATNNKGTSYGTVQTFTTAGSPTVALNTPANLATGISTTPTLNFTGTNPDGETVEYNVQIDTVNTFDSTSSLGPVQTQVVTATGSGSWTIPTGVTSVKVELWGAGGGGAGGGGAGGGSGAYVKQTGLSVTPGNSITYVIATGGGGAIGNSSGGAAGTGFQSGGTGANDTTNSGGGGGGSSSVVVAGTTYVASGGGGGGGSGGSGTAASGSSGGSGGSGAAGFGGGGGGGSNTAGTNGTSSGSATGGTGGTTQTGTNGADTSGFTSGGSSAGASGNGNSTSSTTGAAGSGGAAGGTGGTGGNGAAGSGSDSGGGGGGSSSATGGTGGQPGGGGGVGRSTSRGGSGGAGKLVITYQASVLGPLLNKVSTADAGFTAGHPFASGVATDFTVQAGDTLTAATDYWWRVAAKDAPESGAYGAWSSTRSFTTSAGAVAQNSNFLQFMGPQPQG